MMIRVMMAAPFHAMGRFQGGIHTIANSIVAEKEALSKAGIALLSFETCRIQRNNSDGKLNLENINNFLLCYRDSIKEIQLTNADIFYLHSSRGLALIKDLLILRHIKKRTGCKTVLHIHFAGADHILPGKRILDNWAIVALKTYVDRVVFLSEKTRNEFVALGFPSEKTHVVYNFSTLSYEEDWKIEEKNKERQFLFIGSIDKRKGVFDFLDVLYDVYPSNKTRTMMINQLGEIMFKITPIIVP